ncbi:hypothetical protein TTHERM_00444710 (macronuclear) [Tetrahymena thermophila SB210]|uniref:Uncharacterized protein n=1 Tax=Tetrahymena thermophila (strain SB210) TaxID=312017 RepID=I7M9Z2_TETTS|nr:hypothetical protein TTHERM_00444710 [Tetrahymena thermophila SB210]EAS03089.2 hypothetical protein TTHERM_00444710 [Tetrahymena thermophila SB210]|eukprot:XP_001023334.2 hypothetical protein TTHERM_00444710 [Tetrahymena thermophila SB210]
MSVETPKDSFVGISSDMPSYLQSKFSKIADTPKSRPQGKRIIESKIGISYESPSYFRTQHGLVSSDTYKNPFLSGKQSDGIVSPLKNKQTFSIFNKLNEDQKKDFFYIKEIKTQPIYNLLTHQKVDVGNIELQINERPKFNDEYKKLQESISTPFHRKTNQFTDFVERNDVMNVYGHLNQRERATEFKKVKDYTLDQDKLNLIKTVRENSQPSRLSRYNNSMSGLTPRLVQNNYSDTITNQTASIIHAAKKSLFNPASILNIQEKGIDFTTAAAQTLQTNNSFIIKDELENSKSRNISYQNNQTSRNEQNESSKDRYLVNQSLSKSKLQTSFIRQTLHHKVPRKIIQTKYDKLKEEESAQELKCIDEFEQHLRFIQGNNFGGRNQGSVFFKDSKRR